MDNIKPTMFLRTMFLLTRITFFHCGVSLSHVLFEDRDFAPIRSYTTIFFGYSTIILQMIRHGKLFEETWLSVHNCILGCQLIYTVTLDMRFYSDTRGSKSYIYISDKFR